MQEIHTETVRDFAVGNEETLVLTLSDGKKIGISLEEYIDKTLLKQPVKVVEVESGNPNVNPYILFNGKSYEYWTY